MMELKIKTLTMKMAFLFIVIISVNCFAENEIPDKYKNLPMIKAIIQSAQDSKEITPQKAEVANYVFSLFISENMNKKSDTINPNHGGRVEEFEITKEGQKYNLFWYHWSAPGSVGFKMTKNDIKIIYCEANSILGTYEIMGDR